MRQIQPIKEMLKGTRAYAAGNFDMRIEDEGRSDEIGELAHAQRSHQLARFFGNKLEVVQARSTRRPAPFK